MYDSEDEHHEEGIQNGKTEQDAEEEEEQEEEDVDEEYPENPLNQAMIPDCLSLLCKIGTGLAHAFVNFDCHERSITNIEFIRKFIHVRYVNLSGNLLLDISALNNLTHLLTLNVSKNNLKSATLDALPYLQVANFSGNRINTAEGIEHPLLEKLNLNSNRLTYVSGLSPKILTNLQQLELRGNKLKDLSGIELPSLKELYLARNRIKSLEGVERLINLEKIHLRENKIEKLDGFSEKMAKLQYINLRSNSISNLQELQKLVCLPFLRAIVLSDNQDLEDDSYRIEVLIMLRRLERVDKDVYTDEDRTEAEDISEQRRQDELIREQEEEMENDDAE